MAESAQFILLPRQGLRADAGPAIDKLTTLPNTSSTQESLEAPPGFVDDGRVRVVDSVGETGPKLIEADADGVASLNRPDSPVRAVPIVTYDRPDPRPEVIQMPSAVAPTALTNVTIEVVDASTGAGVAGFDVIAFTNFTRRFGDSGTTGANGKVTLKLNGPTIDRLYGYPPAGYWGIYRHGLPVSAALSINAAVVDLTYVDSVRHYYGGSRFSNSLGVTVGVVDTGVGPHSDLNVVGGRNTVTGEPAHDYIDGDTHGTHVAGLVGANSAPPSGLRGVAPGVALQSYRVFGQNSNGATNYAILKATILAAQDGCDILNLSLGGGPFDYIVEESIEDARNQGMLVVVAAGNDGRQAVSYPAKHNYATAVSAMGRVGTFPAGSLDDSNILRPPHSAAYPDEFIAAFSNVGPEIDVTGLGVGTLSTLPGNAYGPMSGTSMAAPVVAGATASLLSQNPTLYGMNRDRARSDAIERLLLSSCTRRGFGLNFEGYGLPDRSLV